MVTKKIVPVASVERTYFRVELSHSLGWRWTHQVTHRRPTPNSNQCRVVLSGATASAILVGGSEYTRRSQVTPKDSVVNMSGFVFPELNEQTPKELFALASKLGGRNKSLVRTNGQQWSENKS